MLEDILLVPPGGLQDTDGRDSVPDWSSLSDVQILALITGELGVQPDEELLNFESVGQLMTMLDRRGAFTGA